MRIISEPLKYTKYCVDVKIFKGGLKSYHEIESLYRDVSIRNRVVCRFDCVSLLSKYFSESLLTEARDLILMILTEKITDPTLFSKCIETFMDKDSKFRESIKDLYITCPSDCSMGDWIITCLSDTILKSEDDYRTYFRHKPEVVICISDGYLYFSVADENNEPVFYGDVNKIEVLSNAKVWNRKFKTY